MMIYSTKIWKFHSILFPSPTTATCKPANRKPRWSRFGAPCNCRFAQPPCLQKPLIGMWSACCFGMENGRFQFFLNEDESFIWKCKKQFKSNSSARWFEKSVRFDPPSCWLEVNNSNNNNNNNTLTATIPKKVAKNFPISWPPARCPAAVWVHLPGPFQMAGRQSTIDWSSYRNVDVSTTLLTANKPNMAVVFVKFEKFSRANQWVWSTSFLQRKSWILLVSSPTLDGARYAHPATERIGHHSKEYLPRTSQALKKVYLQICTVYTILWIIDIFIYVYIYMGTQMKEDSPLLDHLLKLSCQSLQLVEVFLLKSWKGPRV